MVRQAAYRLAERGIRAGIFCGKDNRSCNMVDFAGWPLFEKS